MNERQKAETDAKMYGTGYLVRQDDGSWKRVPHDHVQIFTWSFDDKVLGRSCAENKWTGKVIDDTGYGVLSAIIAKWQSENGKMTEEDIKRYQVEVAKEWSTVREQPNVNELTLAATARKPLIERIAEIIDPEAFGLSPNEDTNTITDRDVARDRARLVIAEINADGTS
jgi:hypothetical protein